MRVKEAYARVEELKRTANNLRLANQYIINHKELDNEIAEATGMNSSVSNTLISAMDEVSELAKKYESMIGEAEIGDLS